jgi:hypothetical protein
MRDERHYFDCYFSLKAIILDVSLFFKLILCVFCAEWTLNLFSRPLLFCFHLLCRFLSFTFALLLYNSNIYIVSLCFSLQTQSPIVPVIFIFILFYYRNKWKQNNKGLENKFIVHSAQNTHKINLKNKETSRMIALREK